MVNCSSRSRALSERSIRHEPRNPIVSVKGTCRNFLTALYVIADDFCQSDRPRKRSGPKASIPESEVLTLPISLQHRRLLAILVHSSIDTFSITLGAILPRPWPVRFPT
jgi:hypothetical protein